MAEWCGLYAESSEEDFLEGEALCKGDTIYLLGIEGTVCFEYGAWGWGSHNYVPWKELEKKIPHKNNPSFCYCDNFISFWELKWNFDDGSDWNGVPFIKKRGEKMTVKELKENLACYDDETEVEFTLNGDIEVESWTEDKYGNKSVEVDLKLEPCFIGSVTGNCLIDLEVKNNDG